jgi:hypothetical protein
VKAGDADCIAGEEVERSALLENARSSALE